MKQAIRRVALAWGLAAATLSGSALAAPTAEELFARGEAAMKKRDYEVACSAFATSFQMSDGKGALYRLAQCDDARGGRLATQLKNWKEVRDRFPEKPDIVAEAEKRVAELSAQVAKLTLRRGSQAPKEMRAAIDGRDAPFDQPIPVDAGRRSVSGDAPGSQPIRVDITLRDGETQEITLGPNAGRPVEAAPPPPPPPPPDDAAFPWTTAGFIAGGVGVAGLAIFAISTPILASASSEIEDACPDHVCSTAAAESRAADAADGAEGWQAPNTVGLVVGIVGVGLGVTFLVIGARGDDEPASQVVAGPGHVSVRGEF